jgi:hypothetical protein
MKKHSQKIQSCMLICSAIKKEVALFFYNGSYMLIELNHRGPASNTRACVTNPDVIINTCSSTDLAHARDQTFRSADKIAVSDLLFHQYDICCVTLLRTDTLPLVFTSVPRTTRTFVETPTAH